VGAFCIREKLPENHKREYQEERKKKKQKLLVMGIRLGHIYILAVVLV
jgi:predicted ATP-dependent protease